MSEQSRAAPLTERRTRPDRLARDLLPYALFGASRCSCCSTSSAPSRARRRWSPGTTCTSSCTTAATCSASPATEPGGRHGPHPAVCGHARRPRGRPARVRSSPSVSASRRSTRRSPSRTRRPRPTHEPAERRARQPRRAAHARPADRRGRLRRRARRPVRARRSPAPTAASARSSPRAPRAGSRSARSSSSTSCRSSKYPANPPAVGDPDTIGKRTALYLAMIVHLAARRGRRRCASGARWPRARRGDARPPSRGSSYLAVVVAAELILPGVHEIPPASRPTCCSASGWPRSACRLVLWTTIGVIFSVAAPRIMAGEPVLRRRARAAGLVASPGD